MASTALGCVGITVPAAASYPTRKVDGHTLVDVPGGLFVMGSSSFDNATPRWVYLDSYSIGQTAVSEDQYRAVMGRAGYVNSPHDHPACISFYDALEYLAAKSGGLRLPTEAEWENAARGPAVNMQETMEKEAGKFSPADFVDFAEGRFENFVFGVSFTEQIFVNPAESELFQKLVKMGMPFYGWRVYGTFSGRLNHDEAWYDRASKNCVEWGPENAYGLKGMTGNVWEYVLDWYSNKVSVSDLWNPKGPKTGDMPVMRGASSYSYGPEPLQVARRGQGHMEHGNGCDGFRVAAPQDSRE